MKSKDAKKLVVKYGDTLISIQKAITELKQENEKYNAIDDPDKFLQILIIEQSEKLSYRTTVLTVLTSILILVAGFNIYLTFSCS